MTNYVPATVCVTSTVTVPVGNDGLISTNTQTLNTNQGMNVIIPTATINSVNHMEEFNHPNTKQNLKKRLLKVDMELLFKNNFIERIELRRKYTFCLTH
jgi:phosphoribosylformylglycinamidine (FGAM) synthase-like enzyme